MAKWPKGIAIAARLKPGHERVLTPEALAFVAALHRAFERERRELLVLRAARQKAFDKDALPDFLPATAAVRAGSWKVAPIPHDLQDRRVEIVGPVDRKSVLRALTSGAKLFIADFEDATAPLWDTLIDGQVNLMDRWTGAMEYVDPVTSKRYALAGKPAAIMVRPRALPANEDRMRVDGKPAAAALFDFGLYVFQNAKTALAKKSGPYVSLPKIESHREARLWNEVFILAQSLLGLPLCTIKASVVIETLPAVFEMDEIIFELREHLAGLACDSTDLIGSHIRAFAASRKNSSPAPAQLHGAGFPAATAALLIRTCHRRDCFAIGDQSRLVPDRKDAAATEAAVLHMKTDTEHEARNGHDGTCVSHPELVPVALGVFNELMPTTNQLYVAREDAGAGQAELLETPSGSRTEADLRANLRVALLFAEARLCGRNTAVDGGAMIDATSAELSRVLVWKWLRHSARLDDGRKLTPMLVAAVLKEQLAQMREAGGEASGKSRFPEAAGIVRKCLMAKNLATSLAAALQRNG